MFASRALESPATSTSIFDSTPASDFAITTSPPSIVPADGTWLATSIVIVNPIGDLGGSVILSDTPLPEGIKCRPILPAAIPNGLGMATLSCSSSVPGTYAVSITGVSGGISHNITATFTFSVLVTVTMLEGADFRVSGSGSINIDLGTLGTTKITITSNNGFAGTVTLGIAAPNDVSCTVSPTSIRSSGESTLICSSDIAGDYAVLIRASSGDKNHTMTVNVHVTSLSPVAPTPSTTPKLSTWMFYIVAILIVVIVASAATVLWLRKSRRSAVLSSQPQA